MPFVLGQTKGEKRQLLDGLKWDTNKTGFGHKQCKSWTKLWQYLDVFMLWVGQNNDIFQHEKVQHTEPRILFVGFACNLDYQSCVFQTLQH